MSKLKFKNHSPYQETERTQTEWKMTMNWSLHQMTKMLEWLDKDFNLTIIKKMLHQAIMDTLDTNEKIENLRKEIETLSKEI